LTPEVRRTHIYPQMARLYDRIIRHQSLEWTARWARTHGKSFKLFGRGWERHPALSEHAAGEVASGYDLRCLCQASAINLQVNGYGSLHQRLLDALSSGGFVLSRYNPADFGRAAFESVQHMIQNAELRNLDQVIELRKSNQQFESGCARVEQLTGIRIAPQSDPARARHCELVKHSNGMRDWLSDEGIFNVLATLSFLPARVAADLPGFERTTFKTESELHALLDAYIQSPSMREQVARPMRHSVIRNDTYDSLVERILKYFSSGALAT
jgi:hypothetical protein